MYYILLEQKFVHDFLSGVLDITSSVRTVTEGNDMRHMYQSKMYQVSGTSALASYKPAFKVIEGGAKKCSVTPQREEVSYVKALTNKEAFIAGLIITASFVLMFAISFLRTTTLNSFATSVMDSASQTITVQNSDTLWSIAESNPIEGVSTEQQINWIKERNNLDTSLLRAGQTLEIPSVSK